MTTYDLDSVELRERLIRIDQMLADIDRTRADHLRTIADHDRKRQEIRFAPWQLVFTGIGAGVALLTVALILLKAVGIPG
jgi:hypothetical protein